MLDYIRTKERPQVQARVEDGAVAKENLREKITFD